MYLFSVGNDRNKYTTKKKEASPPTSKDVPFFNTVEYVHCIHYVILVDDKKIATNVASMHTGLLLNLCYAFILKEFPYT